MHGPHMRSAPSVHAAKAQQAQALCTALLRTHNVRFEHVGETCVAKTCVDNAETCGATSSLRSNLLLANMHVNTPLFLVGGVYIGQTSPQSLILLFSIRTLLHIH